MSRWLIQQLRVVGFGEGVSYLILLTVAMPLKYLYGQPSAVRIVGAIHGGFFVLYVVAVVRAAYNRRWPVEKWVESLLASIFPLGPFLLDGKLRREAEECASVPKPPNLDPADGSTRK